MDQEQFNLSMQAMAAQRNNALDQVIMAQVQAAAMQGKLQDAQAKINELQSEIDRLNAGTSNG